jgi:hypothetical protein
VNIVLAPKGAIQNFIKNIRYDSCLMQLNSKSFGFVSIKIKNFLEENVKVKNSK